MTELEKAILDKTHSEYQSFLYLRYLKLYKMDIGDTHINIYLTVLALTMWLPVYG